MKTFLFTAALSAAIFIPASGQEVASFDRIDFIPSCFTSNGKAVPVGYNNSDEGATVTIFDSDFKVVKQFNIKNLTYESRNYSETATVKPTGATIEDAWEEQESYIVDGETLTATDLNSMIQKLSSIHGCDFYGFTDSKGRLSCWSPQLSDFYYQEWFGTMYPKRYFSIIGGKVNAIRVSYKPVFDMDHAQWTPLQDKDYDVYRINLSHIYCYCYDFDANVLCDESILCTQTLFNEDAKWEYMLPLLGPIEKFPREYSVWGSNTDGLVLRREVSEYQPAIGYAIYNEDGNIVASLLYNKKTYPSVNDIYVYKLGGNVYFEDEGTVYKYDPLSTSVKEVSHSEAKALMIKMRGRNIIVEDSQKADEAVLVDMGGRIVATSNHKDNEGITINADNMPTGVYSIAVKSKGRVAAARKIILK